MIDKECKDCSKFLTNDCQGLAQLDSEACQGMFRNKAKEVDVSGCC